jgi:hypothetical protein
MNAFDQLVETISKTENPLSLAGSLPEVKAGMAALLERLQALENKAGITPETPDFPTN